MRINTVLQNMSRKLILLNGMTPDGRVFKRLLPYLENYQLIEWVDPEDDQSIQEYAKRIQRYLGEVRDCDILGVSFGGIVAQELAPLIGAKKCFIVSSIADTKELNGLQRVLASFPRGFHGEFYYTIGKTSEVLAGFGSTNEVFRLKKFVGEDGAWFRWATSAVVGWNPQRKEQIHYIRIHGDSDTTFRKGHLYSDHIIEGASHVLALTHAKELAELIKQYR